jgi:hypothetical protein
MNNDYPSVRCGACDPSFGCFDGSRVCQKQSDMSPELHIEDFIDRYATCPLCKRNNVQIRYYANNVILEEHPMQDDHDDLVIRAHPAPVDPGRINPRAAEATYARLRCPASLAPLMPREGA